MDRSLTVSKFSPADIVKKISFFMTDSTEHNIGVIEKVCEHLEIEDQHVPMTLLCVTYIHS